MHWIVVLVVIDLMLPHHDNIIIDIVVAEANAHPCWVDI
jgi:hypothetical protein